MENEYSGPQSKQGAAAHAHGATVNDAVLTAVTGVLHAVLQPRGENVDRFVIFVHLRAP
jgi:hypothetical protein